MESKYLSIVFSGYSCTNLIYGQGYTVLVSEFCKEILFYKKRLHAIIVTNVLYLIIVIRFCTKAS